MPYLKVAKNCENETTGLCEFEFSFLNTQNTKNSYGSVHTRFYLTDGTLINVLPTHTTATNKFAWVIIDINGKKSPNIYGKDIFIYMYQLKGGGFMMANLYLTGFLVQNKH